MTSTLSFDDIFHELHNELETEANDWYLNHFYINFKEEKKEEKEEEEEEGEILEDEESNRPSTTTSQHPQQSSSVIATSQKKINHQHDRLFFYEIPDYLSTSNLSVHTTFFCELRSLYNAIDFQDLQQLTILTHQMSIIHLHEQLWRRFLQAGTGQLKQPVQLSLSSSSSSSLRSNADRTTTTTLSFWPDIVTSVIRSQGLIINVQRQDRIDQDSIYVNFVQNYLHQLEKKFHRYRLQYETIKKRLPDGYETDALNDKIDRFVHKEGLITMQLHFQMRIDLIQYISIDRSYQLEYFQQKPTNLQFEVARRITSLTFERDRAQHEMILFKFGVLYKKLPKSLDLLELSPPTSITTIIDPVIRERLSTEYQRIIQQAKADLMMVLTTAAEAKRDDCQKNFDKETAEIWQNQHRLPIHERLTSTMLAIVEQRQRNITECVRCIYKLKGDFFHRAT